MATDPAAPLRTVTLPDRVCTSKSTGPLTAKVLSNVPCGVEANAAVEISSAPSAIAGNGKRDRPLQKFRLPFMSHHSLKCRSSQKPKPEPDLLQHHLVALFQPAKDFCLRAVRDSDVNCNLILAFLALRIGNFDRSLFILVVENGAFRN